MNRLREALQRADIAELEMVAEEIGQEAVQVALAMVETPKADAEAERQRLLDAALADASNVMERHRDRLGRRVTSRHDATTMRQIYELLRSMAGTDGGSDADPSFQ
jgi:cell division septum initiation protein DivIVA